MLYSCLITTDTTSYRSVAVDQLCKLSSVTPSPLTTSCPHAPHHNPVLVRPGDHGIGEAAPAEQDEAVAALASPPQNQH